MTTGPEDDEERREDQQYGSAATKATDAAVRRAVVESRQDLLAFLRRRLGSHEEAEEVLQRFSLRALERASDLLERRSLKADVRGSSPRRAANRPDARVVRERSAKAPTPVQFRLWSPSSSGSSGEAPIF
jgi:DNA-directed RNA polymerase specialized sigma24 family protein